MSIGIWPRRSRVKGRRVRRQHWSIDPTFWWIYLMTSPLASFWPSFAPLESIRDTHTRSHSSNNVTRLHFIGPLCCRVCPVGWAENLLNKFWSSCFPSTLTQTHSSVIQYEFAACFEPGLLIFILPAHSRLHWIISTPLDFRFSFASPHGSVSSSLWTSPRCSRSLWWSLFTQLFFWFRHRF